VLLIMILVGEERGRGKKWNQACGYFVIPYLKVEKGKGGKGGGVGRKQVLLKSFLVPKGRKRGKEKNFHPSKLHNVHSPPKKRKGGELEKKKERKRRTTSVGPWSLSGTQEERKKVEKGKGERGLFFLSLSSPRKGRNQKREKRGRKKGIRATHPPLKLIRSNVTDRKEEEALGRRGRAYWRLMLQI